MLKNYVSGGSGSDQNQETDFSYNTDSRIATMTAVNSVTGNQVTTYSYGTSASTSDVVSNDLLVSITYPDTGIVSTLYNRQREVKQKTDQLGNIHQYSFDLLGRMLSDTVTHTAAGVDTTVLKLAYAYEVRGMLQELTSYNSASSSSTSNIVNDIYYSYNTFSQLTGEFQNHSGIATTSSPGVQYAYANGSANTVRLTMITYPSGRALNYNYGTSGGTNDLLGRVSALIDNNGTTHLADYTYLGLGKIVQDSYTTEPNVSLTYIKQSGESNGDAGDQYIGLDRFGRVVDQRWLINGTTTALERVDYGFDQDNNRQWRNNQVAGTLQDEYYGYDGLQRLLTLQRGTLNATKTGISGTPTFEEDFALDSTGNWHSTSSSSSGAYVVKVSGTPTLSQNRTQTEANEITAIPTGTGTAWQVPNYDANGNSTTIPQPAALSSGYTCTYDAWNRLMTVKSGATTIANYRYDGINRRTQKITSATRDYYHSGQWQILEERVSTPAPTCPERQFVWGLRYTDDLILRDRVTSQSSSTSCQATNERLYVLHDYFQPTAVINSSGTVEERYGYNAFGAVRFMTAAFGTQSGSNYAWETLYGAYRWDSETGLYQVRNRYLHPYLGTWITRDPAGRRHESNLYAYVNNSPVNAIDDLGLQSSCSPLLPWKTQLKTLNSSLSFCLCAMHYAYGIGFDNVPKADGSEQTDFSNVFAYFASNKTCKFNYDCNNCSDDSDDTTGTTDTTQNPAQVDICFSHLVTRTVQEMEETIVHELLHVIFECLTSCKQSCNCLACSEIVAYWNSGECETTGTSFDPSSDKKGCVIAGANRSLALNTDYATCPKGLVGTLFYQIPLHGGCSGLFNLQFNGLNFGLGL